MKLLVILATVALFVWLLRGDRRKAVSKRAAQQKVAGPERMVECAACGLHLPAVDALVDASGRNFCCADHRRHAD